MKANINSNTVALNPVLPKNLIQGTAIRPTLSKTSPCSSNSMNFASAGSSSSFLMHLT